MWRTLGHDWAVELLQRAINTQRLAHAYLVSGPAHIGKATLAREFAAALNCTDATPPCGVCRACRAVAAGTHPDVLVVQPDEGTLKIEQIRDVQHELALSPYQGRYRVCLLLDAQLATDEAENALLKTLEEPPSRVVLVLMVTDASLLLPTVVSRCQLLALRSVPEELIAGALRERWGVPHEQAALLARVAGGRIGWAIDAAQKPEMLAQRTQDLDALLLTLTQRRVERLSLAEKVGAREDLADLLQLWQTAWRDMLFCASGCDELVVNLDRADRLRALAEQCGRAQLAQACASVDRALEQIEQNVTPRLSVEGLLLDWPLLRP
jgi:DNA polymerase III subunit delta'